MNSGSGKTVWKAFTLSQGFLPLFGPSLLANDLEFWVYLQQQRYALFVAKAILDVLLKDFGTNILGQA
jgi:hypothetical protein